MRALRSWLQGGRFFILSFAILAGTAKPLAQTTDSNLVPVVTVRATQPIATVTDPGVFTMFRAGNTNLALNVWYDLDGTASNGVDYALIPPHLVTIAAGAISNIIVISPLTNISAGVAPKTVVLTLTNSPLMTPINYQIGTPSQALVYLEYTNAPPLSLVSPKDGTVFYTPTNVQLLAATHNFYFTNVEFFAGTNDLGRGIPGLSGGIITTLYYLTWTNPPPRDYVLTAVGTATSGISTTSAPVNISVLVGPPPTNLPPVVNIFEPKNGDVFYTPTNILLAATASDPDGFVTNVEYFAGAEDLGPGTPVVLDPPGIDGVTGLVYIFNWLNVPPGDYPLTAVATDNGGASTTSGAVNITVLPGPPTNLPPVVRIVSPANGATFFAPVNIPLFAYARDLDGSVSSVEFFAGTNDLGFGQRLPTPVAANSPNPSPIPPIYPTNLFVLIWSNAPVGTYALTARATDNDGASTVSDPVKIAVLPSLPPSTNEPCVMSIVATDPVAVEGTNCWIWAGETNASPTWAEWPAGACRWFTNCGPKIATFTVRRFGNTNANLAVSYDIGGTASNGVDYVALPGAVVIPAGERHATIPVIPIDDGPPDVNKTVTLTLLPDRQMNPLPGYVVGFPRRAAAIILDPGPRPVSGSLVGRCFHLAESGPDAAWFCIEYATNLFNWTPVCTNQVIDGSIDFVDPDAASNSTRFYHVVPLAKPPAD